MPEPSNVEGPVKPVEPAKRAPSLTDTPPETEEKKDEEEKEKEKKPKEECRAEPNAVGSQAPLIHDGRDGIDKSLNAPVGPELTGQEGPAPTEGLVIERRVQLISRDLVGKPSEIHRTETVQILGKNVLIDDLTFGTRLVIRPDLALAWVIDRHAETYSEITFAALAERRSRVLADLADAAHHVAGTQDAEDIERIRLGLGAFAAPPTMEVKETKTKATVAGRECVGREIVVNGTDHPLEVLVDPTLEEAMAYFDALAAMGAFHPNVAEKIRELGGFPLKGNVRYALFLDRVLSQEEVLSVTHCPLSLADFSLPEKMTRVPLKGFDPDAGSKPEKPKALDPSFREDEIDREINPVQQDKKEPK